ncbi:phosphotransferase [Rhizobium leguminosarum]|uniref:phosphotransferase n=1 Tax=Rhizobium leguminosarum TaxID=384 RepID=UPI0024A91AFA|nr:phosphotransferase [Rhizobium leguminosarum]MDI5930017.1 phosphotransferase [Rhizobium leguminosarum]
MPALASTEISVEEVKCIAHEHFNVIGNAVLLTGERDANYHLAGDVELLFKLAHPKEDPAIVDLQTAALDHLAGADLGGVSVPTVLTTTNGQKSVLLRMRNGGTRIGRLLTYLPGKLQQSSRRSTEQYRSGGRALAKIARGLKNFSHPAAAHKLIWDLRHAADTRLLISLLGNTAIERSCSSILSHFIDETYPTLVRQRKQIVHNDLNPRNVLVDASDHGRVTGVFDFGDVVETFLVADTAIGAASQIDDAQDAHQAVIEFVQAYHRENPLSIEEIACIPALVATRIAMGVLITNRHRLENPDNPHFPTPDFAVFAERMATAQSFIDDKAKLIERMLSGDAQ